MIKDKETNLANKCLSLYIKREINIQDSIYIPREYLAVIEVSFTAKFFL